MNHAVGVLPIDAKHVGRVDLHSAFGGKRRGITIGHVDAASGDGGRLNLGATDHVVEEDVGESRDVVKETFDGSRRKLGECGIGRSKERKRSGAIERINQSCGGDGCYQSREITLGYEVPNDGLIAGSGSRQNHLIDDVDDTIGAHPIDLDDAGVIDLSPVRDGETGDSAIGHDDRVFGDVSRHHFLAPHHVIQEDIGESGNAVE